MNADRIIPQGLIPPLTNPACWVAWISGITGTTPSEVIQRLKQEYADPGCNVRNALAASGIRPFEWSEALNLFYEQTDAFLYETLVWNLSHAKCGMREWIGAWLSRHASGNGLLAFGDGLGFDSWYFAEAGQSVTYFEVSRHSSDFARALFATAPRKPTIVTDPDGLKGRSFETILCLDVLEHVPDPIGLVQWLASLLRPGGHLIVNAPFFLLHSGVQTHLRANLRYSGDWKKLYRPAGLRPAGGRMFWDPVVLTATPGAAPPWPLRLGGGLLQMARLCPWPLVFASRMLVARKHPLGLD